MRKFCLLLTIILSSCQGEKEQQVSPKPIIEFDIEELNPTLEKLRLSDIAESIEYILLETSDDCLLGHINDIKFTDEYIFILSVGEIYQFDSRGYYIRKLFQIGKGPGECYARYFDINNDNSQVIVMDNFKYQYNIYSFDGDFISSFKDPNRDMNTGLVFMIHNNQLIFEVESNNMSQYSFMSYGLDVKEILYKHINPKYRNIAGQHKKIRLNRSGYLRTFEDIVLFMNKFCDTIYQTTDFNDILPRYIFNYSSNKLTYEDYYTKPPLALDNKKYIENYFETSRYLMVYISTISPPHYIWLFDKADTNISILKLSSLEDYLIENDFDSGPGISLMSCFIEGWQNGNYLYSLLEPMNLLDALNSDNSSIEIESRVYELAHLVNSNDNPILVKIKLQE